MTGEYGETKEELESKLEIWLQWLEDNPNDEEALEQIEYLRGCLE